MSGPHDPGRPIHRAAEKVIIAPLDDTQMKRGAYPKLNLVGRRQIVQRLLQYHNGVERVQRVGESGIQPIAGHLHDHATVPFDYPLR